MLSSFLLGVGPSTIKTSILSLAVPEAKLHASQVNASTAGRAVATLDVRFRVIIYLFAAGRYSEQERCCMVIEQEMVQDFQSVGC